MRATARKLTEWHDFEPSFASSSSVTFSNISFICNNRLHTRARPSPRCVTKSDTVLRDPMNLPPGRHPSTLSIDLPTSPNAIARAPRVSGLYRLRAPAPSPQPLLSNGALSTVAALAAGETPTTIYAATATGLLKSPHAGDTWSDVTPSALAPFLSFGSRAIPVFVARTDPNVVIAGFSNRRRIHLVFGLAGGTYGASGLTAVPMMVDVVVPPAKSRDSVHLVVQ